VINIEEKIPVGPQCEDLVALSRAKPISKSASESSRSVGLDLENSRHDFATPTGFPSSLPSPLPYPRQTKSCGVSSLRLVLPTCTFVKTNSVWALGAKLVFGHVSRSKGILATGRVDIIYTLCICVLQEFCR
jgi:hypothetical protein